MFEGPFRDMSTQNWCNNCHKSLPSSSRLPKCENCSRLVFCSDKCFKRHKCWSTPLTLQEVNPTHKPRDPPGRPDTGNFPRQEIARDQKEEDASFVLQNLERSAPKHIEQFSGVKQSDEQNECTAGGPLVSQFADTLQFKFGEKQKEEFMLFTKQSDWENLRGVKWFRFAYKYDESEFQYYSDISLRLEVFSDDLQNESKESEKTSFLFKELLGLVNEDFIAVTFDADFSVLKREIRDIRKRHKGAIEAGDKQHANQYEDDLHRLHGKFRSLDKNFGDVVQRVLQNGICVTNVDLIHDKESDNVTYNFAGHSLAQLHRKTCYLYREEPESIVKSLHSLGDFSHTPSIEERSKAIGLLFSPVRLGVELDHSGWALLSDHDDPVECGWIGKDLAKDIMKSLNIQLDRVPAIWVIQFLGFRGTLVVDEKLKGAIEVRKSMEKFAVFDQTQSSWLGIVGHSKPHEVAYLNQQLVMLLSHMGVRDNVFMNLQGDHFQSLAQMVKDPSVAYGFTKMCAPDVSERLLREGLSKDVVHDLKKLRRQEIDKCWVEEFPGCLRDKFHILVPKSRIVYGVGDPFGKLEPGTVFFQYTTDNGELETLKDCSVVVCQKLSYHPGNVKTLRCVESPGDMYDDMHDCIVFGAEDGGQKHKVKTDYSYLDGDKYFVFWDQRLIPKRNFSPPQYFIPPDEVVSPSIRTNERHEINQRLRHFAKWNHRVFKYFDSVFRRIVGQDGLDSGECHEWNRMFHDICNGTSLDLQKISTTDRILECSLDGGAKHLIWEKLATFCDKWLSRVNMDHGEIIEEHNGIGVVRCVSRDQNVLVDLREILLRVGSHLTFSVDWSHLWRAAVARNVQESLSGTDFTQTFLIPPQIKDGFELPGCSGVVTAFAIGQQESRIPKFRNNKGWIGQILFHHSYLEHVLEKLGRSLQVASSLIDFDDVCISEESKDIRVGDKVCFNLGYLPNDELVVTDLQFIERLSERDIEGIDPEHRHPEIDVGAIIQAQKSRSARFMPKLRKPLFSAELPNLNAVSPNDFSLDVRFDSELKTNERDYSGSQSSVILLEQQDQKANNQSEYSVITDVHIDELSKDAPEFIPHPTRQKPNPIQAQKAGSDKVERSSPDKMEQYKPFSEEAHLLGNSLFSYLIPSSKKDSLQSQKNHKENRENEASSRTSQSEHISDVGSQISDAPVTSSDANSANPHLPTADEDPEATIASLRLQLENLKLKRQLETMSRSRYDPYYDPATDGGYYHAEGDPYYDQYYAESDMYHPAQPPPHYLPPTDHQPPPHYQVPPSSHQQSSSNHDDNSQHWNRHYSSPENLQSSEHRRHKNSHGSEYSSNQSSVPNSSRRPQREDHRNLLAIIDVFISEAGEDVLAKYLRLRQDVSSQIISIDDARKILYQLSKSKKSPQSAPTQQHGSVQREEHDEHSKTPQFSPALSFQSMQSLQSAKSHSSHSTHSVHSIHSPRPTHQSYQQHQPQLDEHNQHFENPATPINRQSQVHTQERKIEAQSLKVEQPSDSSEWEDASDTSESDLPDLQERPKLPDLQEQPNLPDLNIGSHMSSKLDKSLKQIWHCPRCTYKNHMDDARCQVCGEKKNLKWECRRCTYFNDMYHQKCAVCSAKKTSRCKVIHESQVYVDHTSQDGDNAGLGHDGDAQPRKQIESVHPASLLSDFDNPWTCGTCFKNNPAKFDYCEKCYSQNPDSGLPSTSRNSNPGNKPSTFENARKIYVGGLLSAITENELYRKFNMYGSIEKLHIVKRRFEEHNRGLENYAFITFNNHQDALHSLRENQQKLRNQPLIVKFSEHQPYQSNDQSHLPPRKRNQRPHTQNTGWDSGAEHDAKHNHVFYTDPQPSRHVSSSYQHNQYDQSYYDDDYYHSQPRHQHSSHRPHSRNSRHRDMGYQQRYFDGSRRYESR